MIGRPFLERALEGSRKHAARRVDEMEAARDLLLELGVEPGSHPRAPHNSPSSRRTSGRVPS